MRKRNNLDVAEANFLYAQVLVELSKNEGFVSLSILKRNSLIDEVCIKCINIANMNSEDKEALNFEIKSYKLSIDEKEEFYSDEVYENSLLKPENFNDKMKHKYAIIIKKITKEYL